MSRTLSPLPFNPNQNWPAVGMKLVAATIQGIQAFIDDLGGLTTTIAPSTPAPRSQHDDRIHFGRAGADNTGRLTTSPHPRSWCRTTRPRCRHRRHHRGQVIDRRYHDRSQKRAPPSTPNDPPVANSDETSKPTRRRRPTRRVAQRRLATPRKLMPKSRMWTGSRTTARRQAARRAAPTRRQRPEPRRNSACQRFAKRHTPIGPFRLPS